MATPNSERLKAERQARYRRGHAAERFAALTLMAQGYRILARRYQSPAGEIDLIASRGRRLLFIEVKQRATIDACRIAITGAQRQRIRRAANAWLSRWPRYQGHEMHFDAVFVLPWRLPQHIPDGA